MARHDFVGIVICFQSFSDVVVAELCVLFSISERNNNNKNGSRFSGLKIDREREARKIGVY